MIVVDTSALMAVVLNEPEADACIAVLARADDVLISAGTLTEALIVSERRGVGPDMAAAIDDLRLRVEPLSAAGARRAAAAYARWGKGVHPARLNLADCFAYALAIERELPLLWIGDDFGRTDVRAAWES